MTITNGYATLDEFKIWGTSRGMSVATDTSDDSAIEDIIEAVSRYIDRQTGRRFFTTSNDETRYYTAEDGDYVFVDDLTTDPTTIACDDDFTRTWGTSISTSNVDVMPLNCFLDSKPGTWLQMAPHSTQSFSTLTKGVKVVAKFGYPAVPDDLKTACLAITHNIYNARTGQSSAGNISVTAAGVVIRPQDVPGWAQETIKSYRRLVP